MLLGILVLERRMVLSSVRAPARPRRAAPADADFALIEL